MPTYKDEQRGTWYCQFYYEDWQGMKKKKQKRGFKTKKEALEWESNFKLSANDTEPNNSIVTHASNIYNLANNPYKKVKKDGKGCCG